MADTSFGPSGPDLYLPPSPENDLPPVPLPTGGQAMTPPPSSLAGSEDYDIGVEERFTDEESEYEGGGIFGDVTGPTPREQVQDTQPVIGPMSTDRFQTSRPMMASPPGVAPSGPMNFAPSMAVPPGIRPMGHVPPEQAHHLGVAAVLVVTGSALGVRYGGMYGALAGGLFAGAAVNAYRALSFLKGGTAEADREAKVSGTYAVGGAAIGAAVWAKLVKKPYTANVKSDRKKGSRSQFLENQDSCDIRPVGP